MKYRISSLLLCALVFVACGDDAESNNDVNNTNNAANNTNNAANNTNNATNNTNNATNNTNMVELPPRPWSIYEPGPYNIGLTRWEVTYDAVGEPGRTIELVAWYPTLDDNEGKSTKYAKLIRRDGIVEDATVVADTPLPTLIFSHGNSSIAEQSYFMTEYFASHGWLVVAPNHTGNTFFDTMGAISYESGAYRPQDITALLDNLQALPEDHLLAGVMGDDIVMTGHSFGGYTTLASAGAGFAIDEAETFCQVPEATPFCKVLEIPGTKEMFRAGVGDPRIDVAIPQAPGGYEIWLDGVSEISIPTLLFTGAKDATLPNDEEGDRIWNDMEGPHIRYDMTRGGHFTFSNMCTVLGGVPEVRDDGCSEEFIDPELAYDIINEMSMAFVRHHLFGDDTDLGLVNGQDRRYAGEGVLSQKPEAF